MTTARLLTAVTTGAAAGLGARALLTQALLAKFRRDLVRLNAGDHAPLLDAYADDAVLVFADGDHRWAGVHRGKPAIERFLRDFTAAGLRGELRELAIAGPPWALTMMVRFDDEARAPDGETIYRNRTVLVIRTRWGRIVRQEDFYEDTGRIEALDRRLAELGIAPVAREQAIA